MVMVLMDTYQTSNLMYLIDYYLSIIMDPRIKNSINQNKLNISHLMLNMIHGHTLTGSHTLQKKKP